MQDIYQALLQCTSIHINGKDYNFKLSVGKVKRKSCIFLFTKTQHCQTLDDVITEYRLFLDKNDSLQMIRMINKIQSEEVDDYSFHCSDPSLLVNFL